jgi:hypothetical protein
MPSLLIWGTAIIAASSRPRRRSSSTSLEFWPTSSTRTPGCRASTSATRPALAYSRAVPNMPNRMVPVSSAVALLRHPHRLVGRRERALGVGAQGLRNRGRHHAASDAPEE